MNIVKIHIVTIIFACAAAAAVGACGVDPVEEAASGEAAAKRAPATFIVSASASVDEKGRVHASPGLGFRDSSFYYPSKGADPANSTRFCFVGHASDVCAIVNLAADRMRRDYREGAHDDIEIQSCAAQTTKDGERVVKTKYRLTDDYGGDLTLDREIAECMR